MTNMLGRMAVKKKESPKFKNFISPCNTGFYAAGEVPYSIYISEDIEFEVSYGAGYDPKVLRYFLVAGEGFKPAAHGTSHRNQLKQ